MAKGCLLSLTALAVGFLLLFPLQAIFNYMAWPVFDGAGMHYRSTWILAWPLLFGISYCVVLAIDSSWRGRSKHPK
jgi:hypothetical protein